MLLLKIYLGMNYWVQGMVLSLTPKFEIYSIKNNAFRIWMWHFICGYDVIEATIYDWRLPLFIRKFARKIRSVLLNV